MTYNEKIQKTLKMVNRIHMETMVDVLHKDLEIHQTQIKGCVDEINNRGDGKWDLDGVVIGDRNLEKTFYELKGGEKYIISKIQSLNNKMGLMDKVDRDRIISEYEGEVK